MDTLSANLAYVERTGKVTYDFADNVKSANLDYVIEEDVKAQVIVRGIGKDNKVTRTLK
jgi:predicted Zn-dependent protease